METNGMCSHIHLDVAALYTTKTKRHIDENITAFASFML